MTGIKQDLVKIPQNVIIKFNHATSGAYPHVTGKLLKQGLQEHLGQHHTPSLKDLYKAIECGKADEAYSAAIIHMVSDIALDEMVLESV